MELPATTSPRVGLWETTKWGSLSLSKTFSELYRCISTEQQLGRRNHNLLGFCRHLAGQMVASHISEDVDHCNHPDDFRSVGTVRLFLLHPEHCQIIIAAPSFVVFGPD